MKNLINRLNNFSNGWVIFFAIIFIIGGVNSILNRDFKIKNSNYIQIKDVVTNIKIVYYRKNSNIKFYLKSKKHNKGKFRIKYMFFDCPREKIYKEINIGDTISLILDKEKYIKDFQIREPNIYGPPSLKDENYEVFGVSKGNIVYFDLSDYQKAKENTYKWWQYYLMPIGILLFLTQIFVKGKRKRLKIGIIILVLTLIGTFLVFKFIY